MILLEKNDKNILGSVHLAQNLQFVGFCKNKANTKKQELDIYINDEKIDTILCNTSNKDLEDIYDIDEQNICFEYTLAKEFLDEKNTLSFKSTDLNEHLNNSPICLTKILKYKDGEYLWKL